ncbi:AbrB/MazE/SpoVT family DNA-binding domain-containing protein [Listeria valentina]|uniref:AbrB/MazE/SpoVT family DNA-binding domain-containing protein n=1 Tax=Listeria valentina TaxID=2705293 RepID=UPI0014300869|nr:AbrB/MazE/SpoVT family DNA-binding domain-containing protein [Listeria valentina]
MSNIIKKTRKARKQGNTYITSLPMEVIQALSISEGDQVEFIVKDQQVNIKKKTPIDTKNISANFYEEIDQLMDQYDTTFHNLVNR